MPTSKDFYCPKCSQDGITNLGNHKALGFSGGLNIYECTTCGFRWESPAQAIWQKFCVTCGLYIDEVPCHDV